MPLWTHAPGLPPNGCSPGLSRQRALRVAWPGEADGLTVGHGGEFPIPGAEFGNCALPPPCFTNEKNEAWGLRPSFKAAGHYAGSLGVSASTGPLPLLSHELELSTRKLRFKEKCRPQTKANLGPRVPDSVLENQLPLDAPGRENSTQELGGPLRGAVPQNRQHNTHPPPPLEGSHHA